MEIKLIDAPLGTAVTPLQPVKLLRPCVTYFFNITFFIISNIILMLRLVLNLLENGNYNPNY